MKIFWDRVLVSDPDDCWIWVAGYWKSGYGLFYWMGRNVRAHRMAWRLTYGPIPKGLHCLHKCDNPACVNPYHLFVGTHQQNMRDRNNKDRHARGERHADAKLTADQVLEIRALKGKLRPVDLARRYGVSHCTITNILARRKWRHI